MITICLGEKHTPINLQHAIQQCTTAYVPRITIWWPIARPMYARGGGTDYLYSPRGLYSCDGFDRLLRKGTKSWGCSIFCEECLLI